MDDSYHSRPLFYNTFSSSCVAAGYQFRKGEYCPHIVARIKRTSRTKVLKRMKTFIDRSFATGNENRDEPINLWNPED
jgi:hypothetical protein